MLRRKKNCAEIYECHFFKNFSLINDIRILCIYFSLSLLHKEQDILACNKKNIIPE